MMSNINVSDILKNEGTSKNSGKRKRRTNLSSLSSAYSNKSKVENNLENAVKTKDEVETAIVKKEVIVEKEYSISEVERLKSELAKLKGELTSIGMGGTANEKKIIAAIKSESINQGTSEPVITRSVFKKKYSVSSRFIDESIKNLVELKIITREEKDYTKKIKTFCYRLVQ